MKGLTLDQVKEITEFAQKYHRFARWDSDEDVKEAKSLYPKIPDHGFNIKYIDTCYDSREKDVWSISFREGRYGVNFRTNHFGILNPMPKGWKYNNLYDLCMAYLKGDFVPKKEFEIDTEDSPL